MTDRLAYLQYVAKALVAGAIALVGGIAVGYADETLTNGELWFAISAGVAALGATFGVGNGPQPRPNDRGAASLPELAFALLALVVAVWLLVRLLG